MQRKSAHCIVSSISLDTNPGHRSDESVVLFQPWARNWMSDTFENVYFRTIERPNEHNKIQYIFCRYCPFSLESPSTFSSCFSPNIQSFYTSLSLLKTCLFSWR